MTEIPLATRFVDDQTVPWESVAEGVKRKIMTYDANLMMVKVAFETGGIGTPHQHRHTQMSYVERGAFAITIGEKPKPFVPAMFTTFHPISGTEPFV